MINRYTDVEFRNKKLRLCLTMSVLLQAEDIYDCSFGELLSESLPKQDRFDRQCWLISAMSYKGYALYMNEGVLPVSISELEDVYPYELTQLLEAMWDAWAKGLKVNYAPEEVDLGLLELKKKKKRKHLFHRSSE